MNKFQELAAEIIDMVEGKIRDSHPVVEEHASTCKGNTLLHEEDSGYYGLEEEVASKIEGIVKCLKEYGVEELYREQ